ncbi:hypothetical protein L1987_64546 [Smallanthus sonchifolius]|uniref:Uncharacterized protein n=1 Tax=Smallanthus sonchifolius TaxID=185202 RepID=A0ACB9BRY0_9ASTR|nr:hypothetical protein L1987_64546 [Smallanthus sonchifolius]
MRSFHVGAAEKKRTEKWVPAFLVFRQGDLSPDELRRRGFNKTSTNPVRNLSGRERLSSEVPVAALGFRWSLIMAS